MASKNGTKTAPPPADIGLFRKQLETPERVADLSVAEAEEIRERKRLIEAQQKAFEDNQKILALLRTEYIRYLEKLLEARQLDRSRSDYDVDSIRGAIWRTAVLVEPEPETEPAAEATSD